MAAQGGTVNSLLMKNGDYEYEVGTQNLPGITGSFLPVWNSCWETGVDRIQEKRRKDDGTFCMKGLGKNSGGTGIWQLCGM